MEYHTLTDKNLPAMLRGAEIADIHARSQELQVAHRASVLIPLLYEDGEWRMLFEVRAKDLDVQPGDVCFPGGGVEKGETTTDAVLREAEEELLIDRGQIELLGTLPDVIGPRYTIVTPFIGVLHGYGYTFFRGETDHVFSVPVRWFYAHEPLVHHTVHAAPRPDDFPYELIYGGRNYPFQDAEMTTYFYKRPDEVIWGFTAKVVNLFLSAYQPVLCPPSSDPPDTPHA